MFRSLADLGFTRKHVQKLGRPRVYKKTCSEVGHIWGLQENMFRSWADLGFTRKHVQKLGRSGVYKKNRNIIAVCFTPGC